MTDPDLAELYREVIVEHGRRPRNFGPLNDANVHIEGRNPLCGDQLDIALKIVDGTIQEISFTGSGCAISQASASLMTEAVKTQSVSDAKALFTLVHQMLTASSNGASEHDHEDFAELGKLAALSGVSRFPTRVKCASLAWQALRQVLDESDDATRAAVSTE